MKQQNKDKLKHSIRFGVLLLACFSMFCDYFIIDIPALLKEELIEHFKATYGNEQAEILFSFLYSFYSVPNIILPLFGGILCDKIGYRQMTVIFLSFITLGQMVVSFGLNMNNFWMMILGRFIFGIGGESLNISIQALIIKWFKGSELSFAQALNLSLMRLASVFNNYITPRIAEYKTMEYSFFFGTAICFLSFFVSILMVSVDSIFDEHTDEKSKQNDFQRKNTSIFTYIKDLFVDIYKNLSKFNSVFWCLSILTILLYVCVITFNTFSSTIIIELWLPKENSLEKNQEIAGELMSIPYIIGSFLFPLFGYLTDKIGHRLNILLISPVLLIISFVALPFVFPTFSFIFLGLSYALFGSIIWPTVAYIVPEKKIGIGYGIINAVQNIGMGLFPMLIAFVELEGSSLYVIICFVIVSCCSLLIAGLLVYFDGKRQVSLNDKDQEKLMRYLEFEQQQNDSNIKKGFYIKVPTKENCKNVY